jgi:pimeloyl-ACP methyl ester carboxylesterase
MSSRRPEHEARRRQRRWAIPAVALVVVLGIGHFASLRADEPAPPATVRVLVIRGVFNIFSTGLDDLGQELRERGYDVEVSSPGGCWGGALRLKESYERDPNGGPLVIVGHSMGGRACLHISRYLQSYNIPVKLVVIVDANPWVSVPENVERCVNLYVTNPYGVFHGSPVHGAPTSQVLNYDVTKVERPSWADPVNHFSIDDSQWMHGVILGEIARAYAPWRAPRAASQPAGLAGPAAAGPAPESFEPSRADATPARAPSVSAFNHGVFSNAAFRSPTQVTSPPPAPSPPPLPQAPPPSPRTSASPPASPERPRQAIHFRL